MKDINTDTQMIRTVPHMSTYPVYYPAGGAKTCWLLEMYLKSFHAIIPAGQLF
jgi:hypothetical protein